MKYKIVKLLRWILNYLEPQFMPKLSIQDRKINQIRWDGSMCEYDAMHNVERLVSSYIASELMKNGMIKIDIKQECKPDIIRGPFGGESYKVNAVLHCVKPF